MCRERAWRALTSCPRSATLERRLRGRSAPRNAGAEQTIDAVSSTKAVAGLTLADLAESSDLELCQKLQAGGLSASRCPEALKLVRTQTPFVSSVEGKLNFDRARALLSELRGSVERGDADAAQRLAIAAYLDGVRPNEVSLLGGTARAAATD